MEQQHKLNTKILTGMFSYRESLEHAYESLNERGYTIDDVNLVMSEETCRKHFFEHEGGRTEKNQWTADQTGSIMRVITSMGTSLVIPGFNNFNTTAIVSDQVTCALVGAGVPVERIPLYEEGIKKGHVIMRVRPRTNEDAEQFQRSWIVNSGMNIYL